MFIKHLFKGIVVSALLFATSAAFAQQMPRKTPEEKAHNQTRWMQKHLMITEEQSNKVYDIILNAARDEENAAMNHEPKGQKKAIKRDELADLRQVLSPEQFRMYKQHLEEEKEKKREQKAMQQSAY
jgi:periplasmic protein CpxP/Spy